MCKRRAGKVSISIIGRLRLRIFRSCHTETCRSLRSFDVVYRRRYGRCNVLRHGTRSNFRSSRASRPKNSQTNPKMSSRSTARPADTRVPAAASGRAHFSSSTYSPRERFDTNSRSLLQSSLVERVSKLEISYSPCSSRPLAAASMRALRSK